MRGLFGADVLALPRDDHFLADVLHNALAWGHIQAGEFTLARDLLQGGDGHPGCENSLTAGSCAGRAFLGLSFFKEGDLRQARSTLQKAMAAAEGVAVHGLELLGLSSGLLAGALYGLDDLPGARTLIENYGELVQLIVAADDLITIHLVEARILVQGREDEAALAVLDRLEHCGLRQGLDRPVAWSLAERVVLELRRQNFPVAREACRRLQGLAGKYAAEQGSALAEIPVAAKIAEADLAAALNQGRRALDLLEEAIAACLGLGRQGEVVALRIRAALTCRSLNDCEAALAHLGQAVATAAQLGQIRVFLDQPPAMGELLVELRRRLDAGTVDRAFVDDLLQRFGSQGMPAPQAMAGAETEDMLLSPRELEILRMISQAYSNKSVARALNCSANTVKWHLKNIFSKLDASSREDAVVKARRLNLLNLGN